MGLEKNYEGGQLKPEELWVEDGIGYLIKSGESFHLGGCWPIETATDATSTSYERACRITGGANIVSPPDGAILEGRFQSLIWRIGGGSSEAVARPQVRNLQGSSGGTTVPLTELEISATNISPDGVADSGWVAITSLDQTPLDNGDYRGFDIQHKSLGGGSSGMEEQTTHLQFRWRIQ